MNLNWAIYGVVISKILYFGLTSGLFHTIALSESGMTLEDISKEYPKYNRGRLGRFLNAASSSHLLIKKEKRYVVKEEYRKYYIKTSESNINFFMSHMINSTAAQLGDIEEKLLWAGGNSDDSEVFSQLYSDNERLTSFLNAMWNIGYADTLEIVTSPLFEKAEKVVDLGGGSGVFPILCLLNDKVKHAVVFDLPQIEFYIKDKISFYNLESRLQFQAGNFFTDDFPAADLYALGYICSDWNDEVCIKILKKVFQKLKGGGQVVVMEKLFHENKIEPFETAMMDLCMMVETQGMHRTYHEYSELLEKAGFGAVRLIKTKGEKNAIVGRR